jgi:hypothetical protein
MKLQPPVPVAAPEQGQTVLRLNKRKNDEKKLCKNSSAVRDNFITDRRNRRHIVQAGSNRPD